MEYTGNYRYDLMRVYETLADSSLYLVDKDTGELFDTAIFYLEEAIKIMRLYNTRFDGSVSDKELDVAMKSYDVISFKVIISDYLYDKYAIDWMENNHSKMNDFHTGQYLNDHFNCIYTGYTQDFMPVKAKGIYRVLARGDNMCRVEPVCDFV